MATQFYLRTYWPLHLGCKASSPFGWYSFYHPTESRRPSRPGWLVTYRNKVQPLGVKPRRSPIQVLTRLSVSLPCWSRQCVTSAPSRRLH